MSSFLFINDEESNGKVNIDELYTRNQQRDLKQITIFNKLLARIQKRITFTGKNKMNDKHIWFIVPEYIFGEPVYDKGDCIGYLVTNLEENGFHVKYVHPNALFISWQNWVPSYVRSEIKKKTGLVINEKGEVVSKEEKKEQDINSKIMNDKQNPSTEGQKEQKQYTPIGQYKPTGNLIYNNEMFETLEKKVTFRP